MKIGIYVGSFSPPHIGHLQVIKYLIDNNYVDEIKIIPTKNYWEKQNLINVNDRIAMLKTFETNKIKVDTKYINYEYTYEIMRNYRKENPTNEYILIIGADNLIRFHLWTNVEELLQYKILVLNRNHINIAKEIQKFPNNHFIIVKDFKEINISSSEIRNGQKKEFLTKEVAEYMEKHHLYQ